MKLLKLKISEGNMEKGIKLLIILALISSTAIAQNFNDALRLSENGISLNAKALAMGNAFISRSSGVSSAQFNPAAIAFTKKAQFDLSLDFNSNKNDATLFNTLYNADQSSTNFSEAGVILPVPTIQGSMALAIGFNQQKNFNRILSYLGFNDGESSSIHDYVYSEYSGERDFAFFLGLSYPLNNSIDTTLINGNLNQLGKISSDGGINSWYLSGALEVEKDIFVGATLNLLSGTFNQTKIHTEEDSRDLYKARLDPIDSLTADFKSFTLTDKISWDIAGWDLKLGLIAKVNEQVNVGFTIRLPRTFTIKETYGVTGRSVFGTRSAWEEYLDDSKLEYDIKAPAEFSAGGSFAEKNFTLSGEIKLIDFSSMEFSSGFDGITLDKKNDKIKDLMRTVVNINAGGEYVFSSMGLALRAGFMYMPSAFKDDPSDYDKKFITAGIGYNLAKGMQFNIGYSYGWWDDFDDNYGSGVSVTHQQITASNLTTSIKFNF